MYCLKCGKDTENEKIFCADCVLSMDAYPVKPGTPIHLPTPRAAGSSKKATKARHKLSQKEQLARLKKTNRKLFVTLLIALLLLGIAIGLLIHAWTAPAAVSASIGSLTV